MSKYLDALHVVDQITADQYASAFVELKHQFTFKQIQMLTEHAKAKGHMLSMEKIAKAAGYRSYKVANIQYGKLGSSIAKHFKISGLGNQVQAICKGTALKDSSGHFQWILRRPVLEALKLIDFPLLKKSVSGFDEKFALREAPEIRLEPVTVRQALVASRVGQGLFREMMLRWWEGRCAVTGCNVKELLTASHAIPWKKSSNMQRLDHFNGLPLVPNLDKLFDKGWISFSDEGKILISSKLAANSRAVLGVVPTMKLRKLDTRILKYLSAHRKIHGF